MDSTKRWWKFVPRTRTRPATANDRSPNDDVVRGTATVPEAADLRPALTVEAADVVIGGLYRTPNPNSSPLVR